MASIFCFIAAAFILLHNFVPHSHKNIISCSIENPQEKLDFFHTLSHVFETDLGENHLKDFTHLGFDQKEDISTNSIITQEIKTPLFLHFIRQLTLYQPISYFSFQLSILKKRGPPSQS